MCKELARHATIDRGVERSWMMSVKGGRSWMAHFVRQAFTIKSIFFRCSSLSRSSYFTSWSLSCSSSKEHLRGSDKWKLQPNSINQSIKQSLQRYSINQSINQMLDTVMYTNESPGKQIPTVPSFQRCPDAVCWHYCPDPPGPGSP